MSGVIGHRSQVKSLLGFVLCCGLSAISMAASTTGLTHAQAGGQATLRLELRPMKGFVLQKRSEIWLVNPFDKTKLKLRPQGTDWANDPEHYLETVLPLEWKFAVPKNTKAGAYPLELAGVAYVCETTQGVCLRQEVSAKAVLKVGVKGRDVVGVLEVGEDLQLGQP